MSDLTKGIKTRVCRLDGRSASETGVQTFPPPCKITACFQQREKKISVIAGFEIQTRNKYSGGDFIELDGGREREGGREEKRAEMELFLPR